MATKQLLAGVPKLLAGSSVHFNESPCLIHNEDCVWSHFDHSAESEFTLFQCLIGLFTLSNICEHGKGPGKLARFISKHGCRYYRPAAASVLAAEPALILPTCPGCTFFHFG